MRVSKPRTPISRMSKKRLAKLKGRPIFSTIQSKPKAIRKVNPVAKAKRVAGYRKMLSGKEYKAARAEAFKRAGDQCEYTQPVTFTWTGGPPEGNTYDQRCFEILNLHAHHLRYPKSRPLAASDLKILCKWHHEKAESLKIGKSRMF